MPFLSTLPIDFDGWWQVQGESVEPANVRRNGESGVDRLNTDAGVLYVKRQRNHLFRSLRYPLGLPTFMREKFAVQALQQINIAVPEIVFADARKISGGWQAILVTKELKGYTDLEDWYRKGGRERLGEHQHEQFLVKLGRVLGVLHHHRWQHTCLYPKHIFVTPGDSVLLPDIALLDLEKARRRLFSAHAARRDLDQLRRHSLMWNDQDWNALLKGHQ
ncbi:MAG TPA: lipopolysaccharide kinase InaA family protein [Pseudomonadales bacterium]|nr:lipopolysaccharide kinase InaA family protein [Pseudomonadales bacterium]